MKLLYDLIIPILLVILICVSFTKSIKRHAILFYIFSILIAATSIIYEIHRLVYGGKLTGFLYQLERASLKGFLALALFILVIFCGALNTKLIITKKLLSIRAEMAIIGSILMIPHFLIYLIRFFIKFFSPTHIDILNYAYIILGFLAFLVLIPLTITSFKRIKRKIHPNTWKKIQRFSYVFFLLIFLHIAIILIHAKEFNLPKFIFYSSLLIIYLILKIQKISVPKMNYLNS